MDSPQISLRLRRGGGTIDAQKAPANELSEMVQRSLAILRRRWVVFTAVFLFVLGGVALFTLQQTPLYTARANIVVNSREINIASRDQEALPVTTSQDGAIETEIQELQSNGLLRALASAPGMAARPGFAETLAAEPASERLDMLIGMLKANLRVARTGDSNVVEIAFTSADPATAKFVADEIARFYQTRKISQRRDAAQSADSGFERELDLLRGRVDGAQAAVARYKAANNLLSSEGKTIAEQEISIYKQQDAVARASLAEERARLATARAQLSRGSVGDDVGEALNSQVIESLRNQREQASARQAELEVRYRPDHPEVVKAERQVASFDRAIRDEIGRIVSNLEARVAVAQDRAGAASGTTGAAIGQLSSNNSASVQLAELELRAEALRSTYSAMLERRNAVVSQALIAANDSRLISPASLPGAPSFPNRPLNLVLGALLGLVLAGLVVWLLHLFDRGLISSRDVEEKLGLEHFGNVPDSASVARGEDIRIPAAEFPVARPLSMMSEALRSLRLSLTSMSHAQCNVVGITSSEPGEGKSTLAVGLARVSATAGHRTLIIDGDIRRPTVSTLIGIAPQAGLNELLSGNVTLDQVLIKDPLTDLMVLPSLPQSVSREGQLGGQDMDALLALLRERFEFIVIDTAPALVVVEARVLLQKVDVTAMAIRWNKTLLPVIRAALRKMRAAGVAIDGVVLTRVDMKALAAYGYGDVDYNYRNYSEYYS